MTQQLTTYVVKTTLIDERYFTELSRSLNNFFRFVEVSQDGKNLTIRIRLDVWYYHIDEYFDEKQEDGIIGPWTKSEEEVQ